MDKTVAKALTLITVLADSDRPRGATDLAKQCGWTKSNAFRMLSTLVELGVVHRVGTTSQYVLGLKLWQLGSKVVDRLDVRTIAHPFMAVLAASTGETLLLAVLDAQNIVYLDQIESSQPVRAGTKIGGTAPAHVTANGKALLAFQRPEIIDSMYEAELTRFTSKTIRSKVKLMRELAEVRARGFAVVHDEWQEGVAGVSAPIFNSEGNVIAALGVSGPSVRLDAAKAIALGPVIRQKAGEISKQLGFDGIRRDFVAA